LKISYFRRALMVHATKVLLGLLFGLLLTAIPVFGQQEAGSISGTVKDATGAVIAGTTVKAKNLATGVERVVQTGSIGQYVIPSLTPGNYQVTITSEKFETYRTTVEVTVGGISTVDAQLTVGQSSVVVEVVGGAATEVNTQTQELSQLVSTQQVAELPSLTRNIYDFVGISGNVSNGDATTSNTNSSQSVASQGVGYSINGQREAGTEILLDGVENVSVFGATVGELIPVDSVQEFSIITNNYTAEYGRASGGVVNVTTKSGSNQFHGTAWEFNRLSAYTANTYANDAANAAAGSIVDPKGIYTRNMFGFSAGGPIIKNKLFISETTEWLRIRSAATEVEEVLDPTFVQNYTPANIQAYFKANGTGQLAANPSGPFTTVADLNGLGITVGPLNGVTAIPASQNVFDTVNFTAPFDAGGDYPQNTYRLTGRVDYNLSDRTQMFFRAGREDQVLQAGTSFYSPYPQYDVGSTNLNQSFLYSITHSFSPTLLNNTKVSYTRYNSIQSFNQSLTNTPSLMIVPTTDPFSSTYIQMPGLENQGPGTGGLPYGGPQDTFQLQHDVSWTKGRHNMRFGGQGTYIQLNVAYGAYAQANEQLSSTTFQNSMSDLTNVANNPGGASLTAFTARVNPNGALPCPVDIFGNPVSPCPADSVVTPPLTSAVYGRSYRYKDWALYAQDSWRFTPRLTLNYGVRYEHYGVQHNNHANLDSNFYYGPGSGIEEQVRTGGVQIADQSSIGQFWKPSWGTVAPRVGFAYDIFGDGKSSLRGGYGISYERNFGNVTYNASFNPPASAVLSSVCPAASATCSAVVTNNDLGPLGLPGPSSNLGPVELRMPDPNIRTAQTQFWSLALQREVARNTVVEVGYSGAHGIHLYDINNINQVGAAQVYLGDPVTYSPACPFDNYSGVYNSITAAPIPECLTRPNQTYTAINDRGSNGSSSYNSLNLRLQTQNLRNTGLTLVANYTWSHSLDDLSSTFSSDIQGLSGNYIGSLGYTNPFDPKLDWGNSDYDVRQRFVLSPIWATPWYKSGKGLGEALGGWTFTGIFTARTGVPFSVFDYDNVEIGYTVPRLTPATAPTYSVSKSPKNIGTNQFLGMTLPIPSAFAPLNTGYGISDFGPFPAGMTARNAFRGPGAWNLDMSIGKTFKLTERLGMEFRAEGYDIFNHHNYYVNGTDLAYFGEVANATKTAYVPPPPLNVTELKGGLGSIALGGNHDERRFGQFSLRLTF
jgi:hypothetical protein